MSASNMWPEISGAQSDNKHELILSGSSISSRIEEKGIDPALFTLINLNYLNISDTNLEIVPKDIGNLNNLTNLVLHSNKIRSIPESIGQLSKLKFLDLSRNNLENVPEQISDLQQLSTLNLGSNSLCRIPSLKKNTKLGILDLSHNKFEVFPDICNIELNHLAEIKLNTNNLKEIPPTICQLSALKHLDLSENMLTLVPGELSDITKLKELNLKGNKLQDKRLLKLVDQCHAKQVLDYIRQNCSRINAADSNSQSKGKKGKKGRKNDHGDGSSQTDNIETLCHKLNVIHVSDSTPTVQITEDVKSVRPYIICCIVRGLSFSAESFKKFIQLQTKLHDTVCNRRVAATIATHDLGLIAPGQLVYTAMLPSELKIRPLNRSSELTGIALFSQLQQEADSLRKEKKRNVYSGIHKYLYLLEGKQVYPCLIDSSKKVISFPPITNSDVTKMSANTKEMLIEVTSATNLATCRNICDTLLHETLLLGVGGTVIEDTTHYSLEVEQVKIVDVEGSLKCVYPSRTDLVIENPQIAVLRK